MWGYFKISPEIAGVLDAIFSDDRILIVCLKQRRFRDKHRGFSEPGDGSLDWRRVPVVRPDELPSLPVDKRPHELYLKTTERTSWIPVSLHCRCEMWCLRLWAWMPCRMLVPQLLVPCAWQTWAYEGLQTWHWRERVWEEKTNYQYVVYCLKQVLRILRASGIVVLCFEKAPADRSQVAKSLSVGPSMLRFFGTAVTVRTRPWCSLAWPVSLLFEPWEVWPLMRILAEI
jgi:hypothetical protein